MNKSLLNTYFVLNFVYFQTLFFKKNNNLLQGCADKMIEVHYFCMKCYMKQQLFYGEVNYFTF